MTMPFEPILLGIKTTAIGLAHKNPDFAGELPVIGLLCDLMVQDVDTVVSDVLSEIEELKNILAAGREVVSQQTASKIDAALGIALAKPDDFRISSVSILRDNLLCLLIELQTTLESNLDKQSALSQDIWKFLYQKAKLSGRTAFDMW